MLFGKENSYPWGFHGKSSEKSQVSIKTRGWRKQSQQTLRILGIFRRQLWKGFGRWRRMEDRVGEGGTQSHVDIRRQGWEMPSGGWTSLNVNQPWWDWLMWPPAPPPPVDDVRCSLWETGRRGHDQEKDKLWDPSDSREMTLPLVGIWYATYKPSSNYCPRLKVIKHYLLKRILKIAIAWTICTIISLNFSSN